MRNDILIIVPAFNEAEGIREVVEDIRRQIPYADVLVINDGSSDATGEEAARGGAAVLHLSCNLGIGGAVQTGYRYAAVHGYKYAAQMDGDGQHDPADFAALLHELQTSGCDMVVGSRFVEKLGFQSTFLRRIGIEVLSGLLTRLLNKPVTDPTSGFRICGERALRMFAADYPTDYPEVEVLVQLDNCRFTFREVPVVMRARVAGTSSISAVKSVYYMIKVILAVLIARTRKEKWWVRYEA
ncbi:glycosyltransferase family 2 protein [Paenibacillus daejeonensis]|uniref:glycosyltransferase family 2 protein n=1 Tax=Paenibacillus daejeonensis TaxID=135193 RepID=UPI000372ADAE|nr:glycosyltransferase family 2 protein [Paenibacillus daejeonensis]